MFQLKGCWLSSKNTQSKHFRKVQGACFTLSRTKKTTKLGSFSSYRFEFNLTFASADLHCLLAEIANKRVHHSNNAAFYDTGEAEAICLLFWSQHEGLLDLKVQTKSQVGTRIVFIFGMLQNAAHALYLSKMNRFDGFR